MLTPSDLTNADQHDELMMKVSIDWHVPPIEPGIDERWLDSFLTLRLADVFAKRWYGKPLMHLLAPDRAKLKAFAEFIVEDASREFGTPPGDWQYQPHQEFEGRTEELRTGKLIAFSQEGEQR